jgi:hypothetical protein
MHGTIQLLLCGAFIGLVGWEGDHEKLFSRAIAKSTEGHLWVIQYGYRANGQLAYVAFAGKSKPVESVDGLVSPGEKEAWLVKPDGGKGNLIPAELRLYEQIDGAFRESKEKITTGELQAFLKSKPKKYGIDPLLEFVKAHRLQSEAK